MADLFKPLEWTIVNHESYHAKTSRGLCDILVKPHYCVVHWELNSNRGYGDPMKTKWCQEGLTEAQRFAQNEHEEQILAWMNPAALQMLYEARTQQ